MKKIFIGILSMITLFSCDNNDDEQTNESSVIGKWNLTKIINTSAGGSMSPNENDTHFYQINPGGTFNRGSIENNISDELEGTYTVTNESPLYGNENNTIQKFVELSYSSPDVRFFNCGFDEQKQILILTSDDKLQNTLSGACDGENYEYTKEN
ncbi:hypothetical protein [uncultured Aquimarina sp.]|uniref:hypothetical protein n=1 Tax=uncultured Aquimarina sp. TaxID=575652 RepID=UPI002608C701|nr:hypothetical protein [uncultured Aquimarina sp.]